MLRTLIAFLALTDFFPQGARAAVGSHANVPYFSLLCRVYQTAENLPVPTPLGSTAVQLVSDIDMVSAALLDPYWYDELSKNIENPETPQSFEKAIPKGAGSWETWRKALMQVKESEKYPRVQSQASIQAGAFQRASVIQKKAHGVLKKVESLNEAIAKGEIKKNLNKIMHGEANANEASKLTLGADATRAEACGTGSGSAGHFTSRGSKAGTSLVMDILCLCMPKDSVGLANACGVELDTGSSYGWGATNTNLGTHGLNAWVKLKPGCNTSHTPPAKSTPEARALLTEYVQAVNLGGRYDSSGAKRKAGMLGTSDAGSGNLGCDGDQGTSSQNGICVFYGEGGDRKIDWLDTFQTTLDTIDELKNKTVSLEYDINFLKMLHTRAEEIYEEATTTIEFGKGKSSDTARNQSQKQNPATSADKATANDPVNMNAATIPHFILPWTLLV